LAVQHTVSSQELRPVKIPVLTRALHQWENQAGNNKVTAPPGNSENFCISIGIRMAVYSISYSVMYCKATVITLWLHKVYMKVQ